MIPDAERSNREFARISFSGNERNHLFLQGPGNFLDASDVSGADALADTRSVVIWDPERDGWPDLALINANTPKVTLLRNTLGASRAPRVIAIRLRGGNETPSPAPGRSPRDPCGALLTVVTGDGELLREYSCGTGLAAQNSATILVGLGDAAGPVAVRVRWPSGATQQIDGVAPGTLLTVDEGGAVGRSGYFVERGG